MILIEPGRRSLAVAALSRPPLRRSAVWGFVEEAKKLIGRIGEEKERNGFSFLPLIQIPKLLAITETLD